MECLRGLFVLLMALLTFAEGSTSCAPQINITPENPIIRLSSPLTLNCSSSCPNGKIKWKFLKDSVFHSEDNHGHYSTMVLQSITEEDTSFKCEDKNANRQATVKLYHFSGPIIATDTKDPQTSQPFQLKCEVKFHPDISAELKLIHGESILPTQRKCAENYENHLNTCEVSIEEITLESKVQYKCEVTLRKDSSQRTESATLTLTLKEAVSTTHLSTKTMPLLTASTTKSTASVVTKRVTVQTDQPKTQSSTAFKESVAVRSTSPSLSSSSKVDEKPTSTILVVVIVCVVIGVLVICLVLFFRFKKRTEAQPQQKEGTA